MKLAHLSDTHLGYRAYGRTTMAGLNQREADVLDTFSRVLAAMLEREPDIVLHSGDLFHLVRPSNHTITETFRALQRFQQARQGRPLVLIGGNHDTPRTADCGNILPLFTAIEGVRVQPVDRARIDFAELDLEVLCVPSQALRKERDAEWRPTGNSAHSVLALHGMTSQALPDHGEFDVAQTRTDAWSYVALGDYHLHQSYGPNCCYPGSTDFTSTNIWEEASEGKSWIWFDTSVGVLEKVAIETRTVLDLAPIDGEGLSGQEITEAAVEAARWDSASLPIVRQIVQRVHPDVRRDVDSRAIREIQARALHYQLDLRSLHAEGASREGGEAVTLADEWKRHVRDASLQGGVERERVQLCGIELLRRAEAEADPA